MSIKANNSWSSEGDVCSITLVPDSKLYPTHCGNLNLRFFAPDIISSTQNVAFEKYVFNYYTDDPDINPGSFVDSVLLLQHETPYYLDSMSSLQPDITYYATVKVYFRGHWSRPGPTCQIRFENNVTLYPTQCDNDIPLYYSTVSSSGDTSFDKYRFKYYSQDPELFPTTAIVDSITIDQGENARHLDTLQNLLPEQIYFATVEVQHEGLWTSPGPVCSIKLVNNLKLYPTYCNNDVSLYYSSIRASDSNQYFDKYIFRFYNIHPDSTNSNLVDSIELENGEDIRFLDTLHNLQGDQEYFATVSPYYHNQWLEEGDACSLTLVNNLTIGGGFCNQEAGVFYKGPIATDLNEKFEKYIFKYYSDHPDSSSTILVDSIEIEKDEDVRFLDTLHNLELDSLYHVTIGAFFRGKWLEPKNVCTYELKNNIKLHASHCNNEAQLYYTSINTSDNRDYFDKYNLKYYQSDPLIDSSAILIDSIIIETDEDRRYLDTLGNLIADQQYFTTVDVLFRGKWYPATESCPITLKNNITLRYNQCDNLNLPYYGTKIFTTDLQAKYDIYAITLFSADPATNPGSFIDSAWVQNGELVKYEDRFESINFGQTYYINVQGYWHGQWTEAGPTCTIAFTNDGQCTGSVTHPDYDILEEIYFNTDGDNWTDNSSWLTDCDPCGQGDGTPWFGIACDPNYNIIGLLLSSNNLIGTIPSDIDDLSNLELLDLADNQLSGSIPSSICNLTLLKDIVLFDNNISGTIPSCISSLTNLTSVVVADNNLSGELPLFGTSNAMISDLYFQGNGFTGDIPTSYKELPLLEAMWLYDNALSGCYDIELLALCPENNLTMAYSTSQYISDGNSFDGAWDDFCNQGMGVCCEDTLIIETVPLRTGHYRANKVIQLKTDLLVEDSLYLYAPRVEILQDQVSTTSSSHLEISPQRCITDAALNFDGGNDFIQLTDFPITGDFSFGMWFYKDENVAGTDARLLSISPTSGQTLEIGIEAGSQKIWIYDNNGIGASSHGSAINNDEWHHLMWSKEGTTVTVYLDGGVVLTYSSSGTYGPKIRIGRWPGGGTITHFPGSIDEFYLFEEAKSLTFIKDSLFCYQIDHIENVKVHFSFDDGVPYGDNTSLISITNSIDNGISGTPYGFSFSGETSNFIDSNISDTECCNEGPDVTCLKLFLNIINDITPHVTVTADQFIDSSDHPCGLTEVYSFSADTADTIRTYTCDDIDTVIDLPIYITDEDGNVEICSAQVFIMDNDDLCP